MINSLSTIIIIFILSAADIHLCPDMVRGHAFVSGYVPQVCICGVRTPIIFHRPYSGPAGAVKYNTLYDTYYRNVRGHSADLYYTIQSMTPLHRVTHYIVAYLCGLQRARSLSTRTLRMILTFEFSLYHLPLTTSLIVHSYLLFLLHYSSYCCSFEI
jgi:hypothetical protein